MKITETTGRKSKYARKKVQMANGSYNGNSPFFNNIPEFQHVKPLRMYSHLREPGMQVPDGRVRRTYELPFDPE